MLTVIQEKPFLIPFAFTRSEVEMAWKRLLEEYRFRNKTFGPDSTLFSIEDEQILESGDGIPQSALDDLVKAKWTPSKISWLEIPKMNGGIRRAGILSLTDRVALNILVGRLIPEIAKRLQLFELRVDFRYSLVKADGPLDWPDLSQEKKNRRYFKQVLSETTKLVSHVVVADIFSHYFYLNHQTLGTVLNELVPSSPQIEPTLACLKQWQFHPGSGVPGNILACELLAKAYFYPMDLALSKADIRFIRSADDLVLFARSEGEGATALNLLGRELGKLSLSLHPGKTAIRSVRSKVAKSGKLTGLSGPLSVLEKIIAFFPAFSFLQFIFRGWWEKEMDQLLIHQPEQFSLLLRYRDRYAFRALLKEFVQKQIKMGFLFPFHALCANKWLMNDH